MVKYNILSLKLISFSNAINKWWFQSSALQFMMPLPCFELCHSRVWDHLQLLKDCWEQCLRTCKYLFVSKSMIVFILYKRKYDHWSFVVYLRKKNGRIVYCKHSVLLEYLSYCKFYWKKGTSIYNFFLNIDCIKGFFFWTIKG